MTSQLLQVIVAAFGGAFVGSAAGIIAPRAAGAWVVRRTMARLGRQMKARAATPGAVPEAIAEQGPTSDAPEV